MISDPRFWAKDLRRKVVGDVVRFRDAVERKILPAFANLSEEADKVEATTYERLGQSFDPERDDPGDSLEEARDAGNEYYVEMKGIEQAVVNMLAAALYHLVEQQLLEFHVLEFYPGPPPKSERKLSDLYASLKVEGIDVKKLPSHSRIRELALVANTVKHAEGTSSKKLRALRPDLFVRPEERSQPQSVAHPSSHVYVPLLGQQFYVSPGDLADYFNVVEQFLHELADAIESTAKPLPENPDDDPLG